MHALSIGKSVWDSSMDMMKNALDGLGRIGIFGCASHVGGWTFRPSRTKLRSITGCARAQWLRALDSMASEIRRHIFEKPENRVLNLLLEQANEAARLTERIRQIESSRDYRFGRLLVDPIRKIKHSLIRPKSSPGPRNVPTTARGIVAQFGAE